MKLVTVYPGPPFHQDNFLKGIHDRLAANPPAGYQVSLHGDIDDLCSQVTAAGADLEVLEIVAHGNPKFLGVIEVDTVNKFAQALQRAPETCHVYLSGCNTGTNAIDPDECEVKHFNIATHIAALVPCRVYGSKGYLNESTYAEGSVESSVDDWGQANGVTYKGAEDATGPDAFLWSFGRAIEKMATLTRPAPAPAAQPHDHAPAIDPQELLTSALQKIAETTPDPIQPNPRVAPDFTVKRDNKTYDFLYNATIIRENESGRCWRIS